MSSQSDPKLTHSEYEVEIKDNIPIVKIPEGHVDKPLTKEQEELLLQFQEEFSCRYTDDDKEYVAMLTQECTTPPLIPSYRPFQNYRRDDRPARAEKRKWEDSQRSYGNNRYSNYSHNKQQKYGYNNYHYRK